MSLVEGGAFVCNTHNNFTTLDVDEWNKHCSDGTHFEEGTAMCTHCSKWIKFSKLPFHPYDKKGSKNISLTCPDCSTQKFGNVEMEILNQ